MILQLVKNPLFNLINIQTRRDALPKARFRESSASPRRLHTCVTQHLETLTICHQQVTNHETNWDTIELQSHAVSEQTVLSVVGFLITDWWV
jgi:hypothetical protein